MKGHRHPPGPLAWAVCISLLLHVGLLGANFASRGAHASVSPRIRTYVVHLAMLGRQPVPTLRQAPPVAPLPAPVVAPDVVPKRSVETAPALATRPTDTYFDAKDLTARPRFENDLRLAPEDEARVAGLGVIDVEFLVSDIGKLDRVSIFGSTIGETDREWLAGLLERQQFIPGRLGDEPVPSRWHIRISPETDAAAPAA